MINKGVIILKKKKNPATQPPLGPLRPLAALISGSASRSGPAGEGEKPGEEWRGLSVECGDCEMPSNKTQHADARKVFQAFNRLHCVSPTETGLARALQGS